MTNREWLKTQCAEHIELLDKMELAEKILIENNCFCHFIRNCINETCDECQRDWLDAEYAEPTVQGI